MPGQGSLSVAISSGQPGCCAERVPDAGITILAGPSVSWTSRSTCLPLRFADAYLAWPEPGRATAN
jgi:hypothetical protein